MRSRPEDEQTARLQETILRYLAHHPRATDTARGIARFWIGRIASELPPQDAAVQRALDGLVTQGRIGCTVLVDGTRVYEAVRTQRPKS